MLWSPLSGFIAQKNRPLFTHSVRISILAKPEVTPAYLQLGLPCACIYGKLSNLFIW